MKKSVSVQFRDLRRVGGGGRWTRDACAGLEFHRPSESDVERHHSRRRPQEKLAENFGFLEGPVWVKAASSVISSAKRDFAAWNQKAQASSPAIYPAKMIPSPASAVNNLNGIVTLLDRTPVPSDPVPMHHCAHTTPTEMAGSRCFIDCVWPLNLKASGSIAPTTWCTNPDLAPFIFPIPPRACALEMTILKKELPFTGLFMLKDGKLQVLNRDMRPNGLAFSPDEKYIYLVDGTGGMKTPGAQKSNPMTRSPTGSCLWI